MAAMLLGVRPAAAHCDTLDGPVVQDARLALDKGEVTPVLKWIRPDDEKEIREAFEKTLAVRTKGAEAKDLADRYFFETLVRVHRAGEGAPFTGLKPAGTEVEPGIAAADQALERGSVDAAVELATRAVAQGIHERYEKAAAARAHKDESVAAGREYVEAYVGFIHFVEGIHAMASATGSPHGEAAEAGPAGHQAGEHATSSAPVHPSPGTHRGHEVQAKP
jgi:hypothetical protein